MLVSYYWMSFSLKDGWRSAPREAARGSLTGLEIMDWVETLKMITALSLLLRFHVQFHVDQREEVR